MAKDRKMEGKKGETSPVNAHISHVMGVSLWLHPIISLGTKSSRRCVSSPHDLHQKSGDKTSTATCGVSIL